MAASDWGLVDAALFDPGDVSDWGLLDATLFDPSGSVSDWDLIDVTLDAPSSSGVGAMRVWDHDSEQWVPARFVLLSGGE